MNKARITPAYAGNTALLILAVYNSWDHPRLRGEHRGDKELTDYAVGSPPPTRGTLKTKNRGRRYGRITPAYAGNTADENHVINLGGDHPRLRGEHQWWHGLY